MSFTGFGPRDAPAKDVSPMHLGLIEITRSGALNLMPQLNETWGGPWRKRMYFSYERGINNWSWGEGCVLPLW